MARKTRLAAFALLFLILPVAAQAGGDVFGGYSFMYWSDVVRPGNQINQNVGPNLLREMAVVSLKNEKMKSLLGKHGYNVQQQTPAPGGGGASAPAPAPSAPADSAPALR